MGAVTASLGFATQVMVHRLLERVWRRVEPRLNASDVVRTDPAMQACVRKIRGACWAKEGGRCGIYGA
mgnify:CR=1 FL=1